MIKTFSGNAFVFRTPSKLATRFEFDDNTLELVTNIVKLKTIQLNGIQDRFGSDLLTFQNGICDMHGLVLTNCTVNAGGTGCQYVDTIFMNNISGYFELTTNGEAPTSNRFTTLTNTVGQLRVKVHVRNENLTRVYMCIAEFSFVNNGTLVLSNIKLQESMRVGEAFPISISVSGNYVTFSILSGSTIVSAKAFVEHFAL